MHISKNVKDIFMNMLGRRINRKIVVFESDDWGMIRMPSKKVYEQLRNFGIDISKLHYDRLDNVESHDDLASL